MNKIFTLLCCAFLAFTTNGMAQTNIIPKLYLLSRNTPSGDAGWVITATIDNAKDDYWKVLSGQGLTSPVINFSAYSSKQLKVSNQSFGNITGTTNQIKVEYFKGSTWRELTTISTSSTKTTTTVTIHDSINNADGQLRFTSPGATSGAGTRIFSIEVLGTPSGPSLPTVSTTTASNIGYNSFDAGGNVTADGGATVTQRGLTWDVVSPATASSSINGTGTGSFISTAASVNPNTKYFYRAYATNTAGTAYGNEYSVITLPEAPVQGTPDNATTDGFTAKWLAPSVPGTQTYTYTIEVDDDNTFASVDYSKSGIVSSAASEVISGLLSNTTYYYRVKAVNATGSGAWSATASITTASISTPYLQITTPLGGFGSLCINSYSLDSFVISGGNLNGTAVNIGALAGMTYSTIKTSTFSSTLSLPAYNGTETIIYVRFKPTAVQSYDGNISISGGGAATIQVPASGEGVNYPPTVVTDAASSLTATSALLAATFSATGCSTITDYGFEYSTTSSFDPGTVEILLANNLSGGHFSATAQLYIQPKTTYYYRAFAKNSAGATAYGTTKSFTTLPLEAPVATAATAIKYNGFTATWNAVTGANAYAIDVMTDTGRVKHEGFDNAPTAPSGWNFKSSIGTYTTPGNYGDNTPSLKFGANNDSIKSPVFNFSVDTLSFWCKSQSISGETKLIILGFDGSSWVSIDTMTSFPSTGTVVKYYNGSTPILPSNLIQFKFIYLKDKGNLSFDDFTVSSNKDFVSGYLNQIVTGTSETISGLNEATDYYYRVRALSPNDTSINSNIITVKTYNNPATADYVSVGSGNFSDAGNWAYNQIGSSYVSATQPPSGSNISINHDIAFDQNFTLATGKSITVAAGSTITINPGVTLNLNNQNMVLKSDAVATAALGQIKGSLTNASKVTIERYIPAKRAWRHLSAPISHIGAPTIYESWMESGSSSPGFGTHITGTGTGYWDSTTGPSIKAINLAGSDWAAIGGTDNPVSDYQSYMLFVRGDRTIDLSQGTSATPTNTVLRITGTPLTGLQNKPVDHAKPFSDIGNPYASAVDFTKLTRERIADLFYVWDAKRGTNGAWVTFTGPTYAPAEGTGGSYNDPTNTIIESGQAFIVVHDGLSSVDGGVTFEEDDKVDGNTGGNVFKPATGADKITVQLNENMNGIINLMDGASVWMDAGFDNTVNKSDVTKMINFGENIAFTREGKYLVVEKRQPALTANDTLFVALWNTKQKSYQLSFDLNIDPTLTASLEDLYNNTSTVLNNSGNTVYDFAVTADAASQHYKRFIIVLKPGSTLPCKFVSIGASKKESKAVVNFTVANELNISEYIVERSGNGKDFDAAGSVKEVNNNQQLNSYSFTDAAPFAGSNYYRVKALSKDGKFDYSAVVALGAGTPRGEMFVYPNPVANGNFNLQLTAAEKGNYEVRIFDVSGREVYGGKLTVESEYQNIQMSVPAMNTSGVYILQMVKNGTVMMQQNIISK